MKIFQNLVGNKDSRFPTLDYVAKLLRANEKRAMLHVEEQAVASDGLMLNLLAVLQGLCVKVSDGVR